MSFLVGIFTVSTQVQTSKEFNCYFTGVMYTSNAAISLYHLLDHTYKLWKPCENNRFTMKQKEWVTKAEFGYG